MHFFVAGGIVAPIDALVDKAVDQFPYHVDTDATGARPLIGRCRLGRDPWIEGIPVIDDFQNVTSSGCTVMRTRNSALARSGQASLMTLLPIFVEYDLRLHQRPSGIRGSSPSLSNADVVVVVLDVQNFDHHATAALSPRRRLTI